MRLVERERLFSSGRVIDDRTNVVPLQIDSKPRLKQVRHLPRLVDRFAVELCQLWHPSPNIFAVRIELLTLRCRIEHPEVRGGIGSAACGPLPAEGVVREVCIDESVPEPF